MELTEELKSQIDEWNHSLKEKSAVELIAFFLDHFGEKILLSTSLGLEDQVLTEMVLGQKPNVDVFTLDTGRLFPETYDLIARTNKHFGIRMKTYFPAADKVEEMVSANGINLFYDGVDKRKMCCGIRKVAQLPRAFKGMDAWICGLRKDQSVSRFFNKPRRRSGIISRRIRSPITSYTTAVSPALAANLVPGLLNLARMCVPEGGGGKVSFIRSVACTKGSQDIITPDPSSSSPSYQAANCPGATPR